MVIKKKETVAEEVIYIKELILPTVIYIKSCLFHQDV